jgi:sulfide:quinone oxidoreductase
MAPSIHHKVVIIGGGSAGISVASRLRRAGVTDIGLLEPSDTHYYQPLWTLVGGGRAELAETARPQASVVPAGVAWVKAAAESVDPEARTVTTDAGATISYDYLVVAPGIQLDWDKVPGLAQALETPYVSSNYKHERA